MPLLKVAADTHDRAAAESEQLAKRLIADAQDSIKRGVRPPSKPSRQRSRNANGKCAKRKRT